MSVCLSVCACVHGWQVLEKARGTVFHLELELEVAVSHLTWVLGTKHASFTRMA